MSDENDIFCTVSRCTLDLIFDQHTQVAHPRKMVTESRDAACMSNIASLHGILGHPKIGAPWSQFRIMTKPAAFFNQGDISYEWTHLWSHDVEGWTRIIHVRAHGNETAVALNAFRLEYPDWTTCLESNGTWSGQNGEFHADRFSTTIKSSSQFTTTPVCWVSVEEFGVNDFMLVSMGDEMHSWHDVGDHKYIHWYITLIQRV